MPAELEPHNVAFIGQVKQAILAQEKAGLFSKIFPKKTEAPDGAALSGLKVRGEREYVMGEVLGSGASGVVFAAVDAEGTPVAIKVIPKPVKKDDAADTLFKREIEIGKAIDHPSVVKTHDAFEIPPGRFVVMDRADGVTLNKHVNGAVLEISEFSKIFQQLSEGLQAAHDKGVVHRDLKPENVMITHDGQIKILDFGMARVEQDVSVTATGTFKGTLHYTSPEQITDSKRVGPASDQFAFALMCFEALTGDFAFEVNPKKPMEAIMGRIECNPKTLQETKPELGEEASKVIARMLLLQPEERYPCVRDGFEALRYALATRG